MPKSKKPRRRYSYREISVPMTKALADEIAEDMHYSLMAIRYEGAEVPNWVRVSRILLIVVLGYETTRNPDNEILKKLNRAIETTDGVLYRAVRGGEIQLTTGERESLIYGVNAADAILWKLDSRSLMEGYNRYYILKYGAKV